MEIIPAILPKNFSEIEDKISQILGISKIVQIDICDGKFVPSVTWPYFKTDINFEKILREERGMPEWEKVNYEFDLMVENLNADEARKWLSAGAERIILHLESSDDLNPVIDVLQGLVEIGIAIDQKTNVQDLEKYSEKIQYIQVMGIKNVGFQGQKFETKTIEKIKEIKKTFPNLAVQIDGGVTLDSALLLKEAGVDRLVVGSALFSSDNIVDTYNKFKSI
jgi:ribulose-phosphate 3-epimerase